ncbi:hypothetical protein D2E80_21360 [Mycobacteroides abscessus]|nr:hypothetical protein D2E80_21360 [Mycobacteroides abscessus]SKT91604.1 Taurine catabolism dioxygenase TauD, TfdA family [Mycobacteroides abscessus subsp. massiliense]SKU10457.1 Taurine catabolism dioxygenase TauD, TfdA family [Mycobacteroides abscessus subsp. massiliense]
MHKIRSMSCWVEALEHGGVASFESPDQARIAARVLGRSTPEELLRPRPARPGWSLSDTYGFAAFPWHTDAAVALRPPRWLVLSAVELAEPSRTEVLLPSTNIIAKLIRTTLRVHCRNGWLRYLPAGVPENYGHRLRWDPRVAQPYTSDLLAEIEDLSPTFSIEWSCGRTVIIDNHRTMHRRPAVGPASHRVLTRSYIWEV